MSATTAQGVMQCDGELARRLLLSDESVLGKILATRGDEEAIGELRQKGHGPAAG